jgi:uncharacterized protein (UPF0332 family)
MGPTNDTVAPWRLRAQQNLRAATLLAARHPPLWHPAVSRLYYACYQATCAGLVGKGVCFGRTHGDAWRAASRVRVGLEARLRRLYPWRLAADYATRPLPPELARELVARYSQLARELGITESP